MHREARIKVADRWRLGQGPLAPLLDLLLVRCAPIMLRRQCHHLNGGSCSLGATGWPCPRFHDNPLTVATQNKRRVIEIPISGQSDGWVWQCDFDVFVALAGRL